MQIAALVFDAITPLDIVGPIEVLARMPGAEIVIVGKERGPVRDPRTHWTLTAEASLAEVTKPDILVIPGGAGVRPLCTDESILDWVGPLIARPRGPRPCAPDRSCSQRRDC